MNTRFHYLAAAATLAGLFAANPLLAQQLRLQVNRQSGNLALTGVDASAVDFATYQVASQRGTLASAPWNGVRDTEADWVVFGVPGSGSLAEANSSGVPTAGAVVNNTVSFNLGDAYDPSTVYAALPLGEDIEAGDLSLTYYDQISAATRIGSVEYVGEKIFNNIGITVDLANGKAYLENESANDLTIVGYTIESDAAVLNVGAGYTGLGAGFGKGPTVLDGTGLGEIDSTGAGKILAASTAAATLGVDLGVVVDTNPSSLLAANGDLRFSFLLDNFSAASRSGFVKFINVPTVLPGDFNGDSQVDSADYTVWRDNLGAPTDDALNGAGDGTPGIDQSDYNLWKSNFGLPASGGAIASATGAPVPEPNTLALVAAAALALATARRPRPATGR